VVEYELIAGGNLVGITTADPAVREQMDGVPPLVAKPPPDDHK
jgi:hypothetical protein